MYNIHKSNKLGCDNNNLVKRGEITGLGHQLISDYYIKYKNKSEKLSNNFQKLRN